MTGAAVVSGTITAARTGAAKTSGAITYSYSGQQTVTINPVSATLTGVGNPSSVLAGQNVTFTARASPSVVDGLVIPIQVTSWTFNGTPVCAGVTDTTCTIAVSQSGTMTIAGIVNGANKTGQATVAVVQPSINLMAAPSTINSTQMVTFTATFSPSGVTGQITGWKYIPDGSAAGSVVVGRPEAARLNAHVAPTSAPSRRSSLSGTSTGSQTRPRRLVSRGVDGADCGAGVSQCVTTIDTSGTMWVYATISGVRDSASAHVTKVPCPTGDSILDSPAMRQGLEQAWLNSDPNDVTTANRRERGGFIFDSSGTWIYVLYPSPNDTPCSNTNTPSSFPGTPIAEFHTHPFHLGDHLPSACGNNVQYGNQHGGPSASDWQRANNDNLPQYILDADSIYVAPVGANSTTSNWQQLLKIYGRQAGTCTRP
jgi:hypothetical protein